MTDTPSSANPVVPGRRHSTKQRGTAGREPFKHRSLTSSQVAALHDHIVETTGNSLWSEGSNCFGLQRNPLAETRIPIRFRCRRASGSPADPSS